MAGEHDTTRGTSDTIPQRPKTNLRARLSDAEIAPPVELGPDRVDDDGSVPSRYELRTTIGEGGMGEIRLCLDRRIGREVAMKVIQRDQGSMSDAKVRFFREARVQEIGRASCRERV